MPLTQCNMNTSMAFALAGANTLVGQAATPNCRISNTLQGINLSVWNSAYVGEFTIYNGVAPTGLSSTLSSGGTLVNGTTYYYKITGLGPNGALNPNGAAATAESTPSNETSQTATAVNGTVNLSWTTLLGVTSYNIYRGTASGAENLLIGNVAQGTTTFVDNGIAGSSQSPPGSSPSFVEFSVLSFTDLAGNSVTLAHAHSLVVDTAGGAGAQCLFAPGNANPLTWFFSGTTPGINMSVPGSFEFLNNPTIAASAGQAVNSTHQTFRITNGGTGVLQATVGLLGSTT